MQASPNPWQGLLLLLLLLLVFADHYDHWRLRQAHVTVLLGA
jgi:hypothetical protein